MPILGVNSEKCINCKLCIRVCISGYYRENLKQKKVTFQKSNVKCNLCGHCIAICPEDAIIYEDLGDKSYSFEGIEKLETIASYEVIYNILRANRSIRLYKKKKVPNEILKKVIDVMQLAPTGGNQRVEKYLILSDEKKIKTLSDAVMEECLKNPAMKNMYEVSWAINKKHYHSPMFWDAPHLIFVYSPLPITIYAHNIAVAITYGRLAAQSLSLGTCWIGNVSIAFESKPQLSKLVGIRGKTWGCFTIGYPDISFKRCPPRAFKYVKGLN